MWKLTDSAVRAAFKEKMESKCSSSEKWKLQTSFLDLAVNSPVKIARYQDKQNNN